jgi:hypothetical protein
MPGQYIEESRFLPSSGFLGNCLPRSLVVVPSPLPDVRPFYEARARARARAHAFSFVRPSFPTLALGPMAYNRWAVRGKQGRGRRDAPNHYNRPRQ